MQRGAIRSLLRTTTAVRNVKTPKTMAKSYPPVEAPEPKHIPVRPLLDFTPPPPHLLSYIPSPPNAPSTIAGYTVSTHVIPGSYMRHSPLIPPPSAPSGLTKQERLESANKVMEEMKEVRLQSWKEKPKAPRQAVLWNCINRYVPKKQNKGGVTLFFAHANSFPKEIWQPVLEYLLKSDGIEEVWTWESTHHGDSALLNKAQESAVYDWADNSNDILSFLTHYIPSSFQPTPLPTHLTRVSDSETDSRKFHGFGGRKLIAIGHSFGGCTLALSALRHPVLFSSLVLADPVISQYHPFLGIHEFFSREPLIQGAIQRRAEWSSRDEALKAFSSNPFFAAWHPSVLEAYVERGIYLDEQNGSCNVRLKMSGIQEAACFLDTLTATEVYQELGHIDEHIDLFWIMPGDKDPYPIGGKGAASQLVWRRPTNSANIIVENAAHLIPQEAPEEFASILTDFLEHKYGGRNGGVVQKAKL